MNTSEFRMEMKQKVIGLISDTHGLLRPEAVEVLKGSDLIIHAGDIGNLKVLKALQELAPVVAVRGNTDQGEWAASLRSTELLDFERLRLYVLHDLKQINLDPVAFGIKIVVSGHSHQSAEIKREGVVYLNPGSAGPRRFRLLVSLAKLEIVNEEFKADFIKIGSI